MFNKHVFVTLVDVIDDKVFTESIVKGWRDHLLNSYEKIFCLMKKRIDPVSCIKFFLNDELVNETITDAIIGMRKIVEGVHPIESPNAFKVAGYLAYWWMRHKPVSIHYPNNYTFDDIKIIDKENKNSENEQPNIAWQLKHINELVAIQIAANYVFKFDKVICKNYECDRIKKASSNFSFSDFKEMRKVFLQKLLYYFCYRAITPKLIEHLLEGYTFHPAWDLTGKLWQHKENKQAV